MKHTESLIGFNNHHQSEAIPHTLPLHQNSPQKIAHGLYAEQLSGSAFTRPRNQNLASWLYRIQPSVVQGEFELYPSNDSLTSEIMDPQPPNQLRWSALPPTAKKQDFVDGLIHVANAGPEKQAVAALYLYNLSASMQQRYFYNADGEFIFVLQQGNLQFNTEFGCLSAVPGEIVVIPRGVKFQILLLNSDCRGYLCENFANPVTLPELGVIGTSGLANPRDFYYPVAQYEDLRGDFELVAKYNNVLWHSKISHSPLDVVAWHGNYAPYKYDLRNFNTINSVSYDHPDPSIFTVLTSPSTNPGVANLDFVIFPERWMVAEHTFRPPYFHRNIMSEFMGLIYGTYDAKQGDFEPGGFSIHNCMTPHGPDSASYLAAIEQELVPQRYSNTLAFMFESCHIWQITQRAYQLETRQKNYVDCWQDLPRNFKG